MSRSRNQTLTVGMAALSALLLASCSPESGDNAALGPPATEVGEVIDQYHATDQEFYSRLSAGFEAVRLVPEPESVEAATRDATVVVLAQIRSVSVHEPVGDPPLENAAIELAVTEVLSGDVADGGDTVLVQWPLIGTRDPEADVAALNDHLPRGFSIWFLTWQGRSVQPVHPGVEPWTGDPELYNVHPHTIFVQGPAGVRPALVSEHEAGLRAMAAVSREAEQHQRLSDLAAAVGSVHANR